jgi:outer membrane protein assembly factor BamB
VADPREIDIDTDKNGMVTKAEWDASTAMTNDRNNADRFVGIRPGGSNDATDTHVAWETTKGLNEILSSLFYRSRIYVVADGGRVTIFRPATGERMLDRQPIGADGQYIASPIGANGFIYLVSERGTVTILRAADKLDIVASNLLGESVRSTPALAGTGLYVRTAEFLWAFGE